jgi:hypothetical protein
MRFYIGLFYGQRRRFPAKSQRPTEGLRTNSGAFSFCDFTHIDRILPSESIRRASIEKDPNISRRPGFEATAGLTLLGRYGYPTGFLCASCSSCVP